MGMFDTIRDAIAAAAQQNQGGGQQQPAQQAPDAAQQAGQQPAQQQGGDMAGAVMGGLGVANALANVNIEQVLENLAQQKGRTNLNWRTSIADLMRLVDLDPSLENREHLADELGYTGTKGGSAEMNIWLHRKVMEQLEQNGGQVPDSLKH